MANLRDLLDGKTLHDVDAAASPLATHISKHMQDPVGATKDSFGKLSKAKLQYDMAREETQRNLAPVKSVINHLSQMHNLDPNQDVDPTMGMDPNNPGNNQFQDEEGNPVNMGNTVGKMNQTRPSLVGTQPGVAPGDGQTVRPPKLGQAQPGGPGARNAPSPNNAGVGKQAARPKGSGKLPGAKGPGDPKNVSRNKKAQSGTTGRQIKVNVSAALDMQASASYSNVESSFGLGSLKTATPAIPVGTVLAAADIGYNELRDLLQEAMNTRFKRSGKGGSQAKCNSCSPGATPWITDVFPMDNYFIYNDNGKTFKQEYTLEDNDVELKGDPEKVKISYVAAARQQMKAMMSMPSGGGGGGMGKMTPRASGGPVRTTGIRLNAKKKKRVKAGPAALADKVTDNPGDEVAVNERINAKRKRA